MLKIYFWALGPCGRGTLPSLLPYSYATDPAYVLTSLRQDPTQIKETLQNKNLWKNKISIYVLKIYIYIYYVLNSISAQNNWIKYIVSFNF